MVIASALTLICDICKNAVRHLRPRPTKPPGKYVFNYLLWIDVFTAHDVLGNPFAFLNIVCDGTSFGVQIAFMPARGVPHSSKILQTFNQSWTSWAGWPSVIMVDRGKECMKDFADEVTRHGVELESVPFGIPVVIRKSRT